MFKQDKKKHLLFYTGRQLALARSEFILAYSQSVAELETLLQAACVLVEPNYTPDGDAKAIEQVRGRLKRALTDSGIGMLKRAVAEYVATPKKFNLRRWVEAVEHSVNRAGFVISNDLNVSMGIIRKEAGWLTPMRSIQKVRELLVFASSPEYLTLREAIGLAVGG